MPRGDRTGPAGMGPMSGRGAGYCAGFAAPGFVNGAPGRGMGMGRGRGFGRGSGFGANWRNGWTAAPYAAGPYPANNIPAGYSEAEILKNQAQQLGEMLDNVNKRLSEIDQKKQ